MAVQTSEGVGAATVAVAVSTLETEVDCDPQAFVTEEHLYDTLTFLTPAFYEYCLLLVCESQL